MRRQRNMAQMKEQINTSKKNLNEMEISNLTDAEFKTLVIRMLKELSEDLSSIKNIQSVLLIRFLLKVRSYGICLSLPGLFDLA